MKQGVISLTLMLLFSGTVFGAGKIYVSDQLETSLRRGEGTKFQILRMLKSGEMLELLETNKTTGYAKVRTSSGKEGFVLSRYLMNEPAAREQLDKLTMSDQELRGTIVERENRISELEEINKTQTSELEQINTDKQLLDTELTEIKEATADVLTIKRSNKTLTSQVAKLTQEKNELLSENNDYKSNTKQDWFLRGAGVILLGILIGLILPRIRRNRGWGEL